MIERTFQSQRFRFCQLPLRSWIVRLVDLLRGRFQRGGDLLLNWRYERVREGGCLIWLRRREGRRLMLDVCEKC